MFFLSLLVHLHLFLLFAPHVSFRFWIIARRYCSVLVLRLLLLFLLLPVLFFRSQFTLWKLDFCFVWFNLPASSVLIFCTVRCRCLSRTLSQQQHNNQHNLSFWNDTSDDGNWYRHQPSTVFVLLICAAVCALLSQLWEFSGWLLLFWWLHKRICLLTRFNPSKKKNQPL